VQVDEKMQTASVILAAGKGTRMTGYDGNKTLLPLVPAGSPYEGERPFLVEILENLPPGPKSIVVHHRAEEVKEATRAYGAVYCPQPTTNGTGGAVLAARSFLEGAPAPTVILTMGDVPMIRPETYGRLVDGLKAHALVVLVFEPEDPGRYGRVEMDGDRAVRIVEWEYWRSFSPEEQARLKYCNAGVYAARRNELLKYLGLLAARPHTVRKEKEGKWVEIQEYFLPDLVALMSGDGLSAGVAAASEEEVSGVDTPEALARVQQRYRARKERVAEAF